MKLNLSNNKFKYLTLLLFLIFSFTEVLIYLLTQDLLVKKLAITFYLQLIILFLDNLLYYDIRAGYYNLILQHL